MSSKTDQSSTNPIGIENCFYYLPLKICVGVISIVVIFGIAGFFKAAAYSLIFLIGIISGIIGLLAVVEAQKLLPKLYGITCIIFECISVLFTAEEVRDSKMLNKIEELLQEIRGRKDQE